MRTYNFRANFIRIINTRRMLPYFKTNKHANNFMFFFFVPLNYSRASRYSHHSRPASNYSYRSGPPAPSEVSTVKTKITRRPGMTIETMSAPNPFCPNTKGICCLMLLLNLGLILVTLGFVIVIQFFEPLFVW